MAANNQIEALLKYLKTHKRGITAWVAVQELGILCVHKRAHELEELGYKITRIPVYGENRYGNKVRLIRYALA